MDQAPHLGRGLVEPDGELGGTDERRAQILVRFAARDLGLEIDELLTGPTAIAFIDGDAAAVAKALRDYARTNPALVVKGGLLGTKLQESLLSLIRAETAPPADDTERRG